jgi:AcrR family transcriptional regulator
MRNTDKRQLAIENMQQQILTVSSQLFQEEGYEKTTLRKIAAVIGCNPATIYNYYGNKEAIFFALQEQAFTQFYEAFEDIRESNIKGFQKLRKMGRKYVDFGLNHPNLYELMFILKPPMQAAEALDPEWNIGAKNYDLLKEAVAECIEEGSIRIQDIESGAFMIWSMVHGLVTLRINKHCEMMMQEDLPFIANQAYLSFENLLKTL